jgi:2,5-furandicarboxylate decarboxylase 1
VARDLRTYLAQLETELPDEFLRVESELDPEFEVTAVLQHLENAGRFPAVLFDNVRNLKGEPGHRQLMNVVASRKRIALAIGLSPTQYRTEVTRRIADAANHPITPVTIDRAEAPVREVVITGDNLDLADLPIVRQHEMDGGPYMTMNMINVDPETGIYNGAFQRLMYRGARETGTCMAPFDTYTIFKRFQKLGRPCPVAYVVGHHPAFELAMGMRVPFDQSEYEVASALLGEPLRLVPSETFGSELLVPADAEIVLEGYIPPDVYRAEGPFGEWSGYYSGQRMGEVVQFTAMTRRRDAIMRTIFSGHREHTTLGGWEGEIFRRVAQAVPGVRAVSVAPSGAGMHTYISIQKRVDGDAKVAAMAAASIGFTKLIIVVDEDVDVFAEEQVWWAVAVRFQAHDIDILRGIKGSIVDPSNVHPTAHSLAIIDATEPKSRPFPTRLRVPEEVMRRIDLEDVLAPAEHAATLTRFGAQSAGLEVG